MSIFIILKASQPNEKLINVKSLKVAIEKQQESGIMRGKEGLIFEPHLRI